MPEQSLLTEWFQRAKSAREILLYLMIWLQVTPFANQWNLAQLDIMPGWMGLGLESSAIASGTGVAGDEFG
ncbi:hypothetical protein PTT_07696 [Pyrenophora teres f. teres 0-1]|uniref:Uncharacterized protein n=1 Tax=Pyrenophora teres f. teres (strain 0-1) TaxID=861557 RepID=E3RI79_PYRTT|nr:hypothetical protein PTT_07696 [Pyrenophora teres f. teres 0-1]